MEEQNYTCEIQKLFLFQILPHVLDFKGQNEQEYVPEISSGLLHGSSTIHLLH